MKTVAATLVAFALLSGAAQARPADNAYGDQTAHRSYFDQLNDSAPHSAFSGSDGASRSLFDQIQDSAPRSAGPSGSPLDLTGE
jgi:hypothetical protein